MSTKNASKSRPKRSRSRSPVKSRVRTTRLLVSNIAFNTTFSELKDLFKEKIGICGRLDFIERNGKFTGNATMDFKTLEGAQKAVDVMHKFEINGRELVVREESIKDRERLNLGVPSRGSSLPMIQSQNSLAQLVSEIEREGPITNTLFIANLDYSLTWQKLKDLFKSAGRVRHVDLKTDEAGKSKGFGHVAFETPEEAILAIHLFNNKTISKREVKLRMDKSGEPLRGRLNMSKFVDNECPAPPPMRGDMNSQIKRLFGDILDASSNPRRKNPQALKALDELLNLAKIYENKHGDVDRDYGYNGGHHSARDDVYYHSQNYDSPHFNDRAMMSGGNKSSGGYDDYGRDYPSSKIDDYIENLSQPRNNSGSFDMNMVEEMLYKMKCSGNLDQGSLMNVISNVMKRSSSDSYPGPDKAYINPRSSGEFMSGKHAPPPTTLLIKNIPFSYTWKDLQVSFSQVPGIEHIEILRDDFNRSKGVGLVRFDSPSEAIRCKNVMDGTLLDGRPIHIEIGNSF